MTSANLPNPGHIEKVSLMSKKGWWISGILLATGLLAAWLILVVKPDWAEVGRIFSSLEAFKEFILGFGFWSPVIFFLIQVSQVIISPIPGNVTTLAGGAIFGALPGFFLSGVAILTGSLLAFYLARRFGQKLVIKLVGQKVFDKYNRFFNGKFALSLLVLFLVPFFPDDALCLLAGLSSMPLRLYILFLIIGRLPGVLLTSLVGGGVITLSFWGWVIFGGLSLVAILVFFKYGDKFEGWLNRMQKPSKSLPE